MNAYSLDFQRLYGSGGAYDIPADVDSVAVGNRIATVYPPYSYERPLPERIESANAGTPHAVTEQYASWNASYRNGASTELFAIENAILLDRTLYVPVSGEWAIVHETNRQFEQQFKVETLTQDRLNDVLRARSGDRDFLYIGTVGSENYAHWLVDDLTRAKALVEHFAGRNVTILLDAYFPAIDNVRHESLRALLGDDERFQIMFIDKKRAHFFERMFYVSPNTYHPFLKSPQAIRDLRTRFAVRGSDAPKRLFVGRKALWRNLINAEEVASALQQRGFVPVMTDAMAFAEQAALFANAERIVGVSGASMANTIFAPSDIDVSYIAGEGFVDPFYWDLAAHLGHRYSVYFGTPWKPEKPTFSSFRLEREQLEQLLEDVS